MTTYFPLGRRKPHSFTLIYTGLTANVVRPSMLINTHVPWPCWEFFFLSNNTLKTLYENIASSKRLAWELTLYQMDQKYLLHWLFLFNSRFSRLIKHTEWLYEGRSQFICAKCVFAMWEHGSFELNYKNIGD